MNKKELIDFLNEVIDANEVPLRIKHRALNLKLRASAVNEPEITDEEIEKWARVHESDGRLNGHDTSAAIRAAKAMRDGLIGKE